MKILKFILPIVLIFVLVTPTYAMHLSENRVIDRELTVEKDENIVKNSIDGEGVSDKKPSETFIMSRPVYFKRVLLPFFILFSLGPICLAVEYEINRYKKRLSR
jgi:hypothetical protein